MPRGMRAFIYFVLFMHEWLDKLLFLQNVARPYGWLQDEGVSISIVWNTNTCCYLILFSENKMIKDGL